MDQDGFRYLDAVGVPPAVAADLFNISEHMIPMRDGVKLHTVVFIPKGRSAPLPILFVRTPYGVSADERAATGSYEFLNEDGYIFAFQDIRGRFKSEGMFVMQRPPRNRQDRSKPSTRAPMPTTPSSG